MRILTIRTRQDGPMLGGGLDNISESLCYKFSNQISLYSFFIYSCLFRTGPKNWGRVSSYCLGYNQSPINLDTSTAVRGGVWDDLTFVGCDFITEENTNLENNGHSVELEVFKFREFILLFE